MFFLNKKKSDDSINSDEFGWWFNEININLDNSFTDDEENFDDGDEIGGEKMVDNNSDDIFLAEEPQCETSSRSYTPERLIRTEDYRILINTLTPIKDVDFERNDDDDNYRRDLNNLIDKKLIGASQLEALLDPDALDIKIPVALKRRRILNEGKNKSEKSFSSIGDLLAIANSESPKRSATPDFISSGSSCERLNNEFHNREMITEVSSIKTSRQFYNEFNNRDNSAEDSSPENKLLSIKNSLVNNKIKEEEPEIFVDKLKQRINHMKNINRDIFQDLCSLKTNFQLEERKTGNLTTEATRLKKEIRDLRYLDDLVILLQGELERISQRNWPFNLGHADNHSEEINLVV